VNCKGKLVDLSVPKVMGILNITPDSFFEGSRATNLDVVLEKAQKMLAEGATFLDLGGHSTRPNSPAVSAQEEADRVLPAIDYLVKNIPQVLISVDTFRASIAKAAVEAGACMINDVSGGLMDTEMYTTVAQLQVPYVLMHMRGTIASMMEHTEYENPVLELLNELQPKIAQLRSLGVNDVIVDLGYGFSKTSDTNYQLLNAMEKFQLLDCPILTGISRKSMIWRNLGVDANQALNGTTVLHTIALQKGSSILRVHDVAPAVEAIKLVELLHASNH
jgi:dihydropteroate synthase